MKIRAKANGNVLEMDEGAAEPLLASGIYELADDSAKAKQPTKAPAPKPAPPPSPARKGSTKVAPMTTQDMPAPPKKLK